MRLHEALGANTAEHDNATLWPVKVIMLAPHLEQVRTGTLGAKELAESVPKDVPSQIRQTPG